jgi:hypothetical protein
MDYVVAHPECPESEAGSARGLGGERLPVLCRGPLDDRQADGEGRSRVGRCNAHAPRYIPSREDWQSACAAMSAAGSMK